MNQLLHRVGISLFGAMVLLALLVFPVEHVYAQAQAATGSWYESGYGTDVDCARKGTCVNSRATIGDDANATLLHTVCSIIPFPGADYCTNDQQVFNQLYQKSVLVNMGKGMAMMYQTPPADFGAWIADTGRTLGFAPQQVHAQGVGFNGLAPLLPIWKAFRNIAYLLLALSMIIIGFMVMFRKKIDPKTVVTVQNALPRIIVTMLLITFSYAIVGLMIDIMYVAIAFINVVVQTGFSGQQNIISRLFADYTSGGGFVALLVGVFGPVINYFPGAQSLNNLANAASGLSVQNLLNGYVGGQVTQAVQNFFAGIFFTAGTLGINILFLFIITIAYLFGFIRILFMLLNSYIQILISVITAPLQILMDVFPGGNGFSMWSMNLISNLIVFPITIFFLILGNVLSSSFGQGTLWVAPLLMQPFGSLPTSVQTPLGAVNTAAGAVSGTSGSESIQIGGFGGLALVLISLGMVLIIPTIVDSIKEAFKAKAAVPAGVGAVFGPMGAGIGQAFQLGYQGMFIASPFLHKTQPSTPIARSMQSQQGGVSGAMQQATGSGSGHP